MSRAIFDIVFILCSLLAVLVAPPARVNDCVPPERPVEQREVPPTPERGQVTIELGDPLGWLVRSSAADAAGRDPNKVPITNLPDGASHEVVVRALEGIDRLRVLDLGRTGLRDLDAVGALDTIGRLVLYDTQVADLAPLAGVGGLQVLDIRTTPVVSLAPIAGMQYLRELAVDETSVSEVGPLAEHPCLERLTLARTEVSNVTALGGLPRLRVLSLAQTPIRDVRALAKLRNLEELDLSGTPVADIRALTALHGLRVLSLRGTKVRRVDGLMRMRQLERLDLRDTAVAIDDIAELVRALPYTIVSWDVSAEEVVRHKQRAERQRLADSAFHLARLIWELGDDHDWAMRLASSARMLYADNGVDGEASRRAVDAWLSVRR